MAEIHHNMDTLLQSDEFRDKMRRIPPHLKGVFVKAVEDLYDRESEKMLQLIWESRQEMRETFLTMEDEQNDLRSQSRMLEERRKEADRNYLRGRKSRTGRAASRLSTTSDITTVRGNVDAYNRRTPMMGSRMSGDSDLQLLPEASGARASSAGVSHRPAPTPVFVKSIEELRDELFKHLSTAETKVESERERQKELLEWLKAEKKNKQQEKVEKANELMEEMTQMEKIKAKDKERQEQRLKERLEEKKKLKEINSSLTPVESVQIETVVQIEPEPIGAAVIVEPSSEYKEKHKKKKHRHRDDEESNIGDGDGEERKERKEKKKKHKNKDRDKDGEAQLGIENEETKERRKEKKKHRHRHDDEAPDDATGEQDEDKERRREKKKHRHRRGSTAEGAENGLPETPEEAERRERKKEKKRSRKEKKRQEAANEEPENEV